DVLAAVLRDAGRLRAGDRGRGAGGLRGAPLPGRPPRPRHAVPGRLRRQPRPVPGRRRAGPHVAAHPPLASPPAPSGAVEGNTMFDGLLMYILGGAVIGILARFFKPGADPIGWIMTIVLGALGALAGSYIAGMLGVTGLLVWAVAIL